MKKQNDTIIINSAEDLMEDNIQIKESGGIDIVQYQPKGVCSKLMQIRIKNNIIQDVEFVGGCNGNLSGIGILIKGMDVHDVINKLSGLPCGSRPTSCPDQLSQGLEAYLRAKAEVNV